MPRLAIASALAFLCHHERGNGSCVLMSPPPTKIEHPINMPSNTNDPYVPALSRHIFTPGGCSSGRHEQPYFNESSTGFDEVWEGYILVPAPISNCILKVSADDNACFYLEAFEDYKADLPPRGPAGGGPYASAKSQPIPHLEKGYYRAKVTFKNIDYPGANVARLEVLLNGEPVTFGQLETHNLLTEEQAQLLLGVYTPVDYINCLNPDTIWQYAGGDCKREHEKEVEKFTSPAGVYDAVAHARNGYYYNTCALRVSIALCNSDVDISSHRAANIDADPNSLPPHGYVILSANRMTSFFEAWLGCSSDFSGVAHYRYLNPGQDIICFGGLLEDDNDAHVGICQGTVGASANKISREVWILYRPTWGPPIESPMDK